MANGLRIPCGATARHGSARLGMELWHSGAFAAFLCVNSTQLTLAESAERRDTLLQLCVCECVCVARFCGTSKSTQLLPGKNAETVRKRKSQWQQHRHRPLPLSLLSHAPNDDISCADQCHTLLPSSFPIAHCCPWANLASARRSAVKMPVESSQGLPTCMEESRRKRRSSEE